VATTVFRNWKISFLKGYAPVNVTVTVTETAKCVCRCVCMFVCGVHIMPEMERRVARGTKKLLFAHFFDFCTSAPAIISVKESSKLAIHTLTVCYYIFCY